jgi:hypothetical protein
LSLQGREEGRAFATEGLEIAVEPVEAPRFDTRLTVSMSPGPTMSYGGFWTC